MVLLFYTPLNYVFTSILVFLKAFFLPDSVPGPFLVQCSGSALYALPKASFFLSCLNYIIFVKHFLKLSVFPSSPLFCDAVFYWTQRSFIIFSFLVLRIYFHLISLVPRFPIHTILLVILGWYTNVCLSLLIMTLNLIVS